MSLKILASLSLSLLLLLPGCSTTCTLLGCPDALRIIYSTALSPGAYSVEISSPLGNAICSVTFAQGVAPTQTCTGTLTGLTIGQTEMSLAGTPANIAVDFTRGDVQVATGSFVVTYETTQPNGPGCPPDCTSSEEGLTITN
jgi:hypothetical protein